MRRLENQHSVLIVGYGETIFGEKFWLVKSSHGGELMLIARENGKVGGAFGIANHLRVVLRTVRMGWSRSRRTRIWVCHRVYWRSTRRRTRRRECRCCDYSTFGLDVAKSYVSLFCLKNNYVSHGLLLWWLEYTFEFLSEWCHVCRVVPTA